MTADTVAQLRALQARLADPEQWTQGYFARTADGRECEAGDPEAVRWCVLGHAEALGLTWDGLARVLLSEAAARRYAAMTNDVNDDIGLAAVRLVVADAIAAAEAEEGTP